MAKSIIIDVNGDVLRTLRENSGWKEDEVSEKLKIPIDNVMKFETGKKSPTLRQLEKLSGLFKYPLTSFLMSKPPLEKPLPADYRLLDKNLNKVFDKNTILAIRNSRDLQETYKELSDNMGYSTKPNVSRVLQKQDPQGVSAKYRDMFGLSLEKQKKMRDSYKMFGYLREQIEQLNVLVLQFSMPVEDARGFVLTDEQPATIVVNTKDSIEARIFSLMHEFGHVLLNNTVIDMPGKPKRSGRSAHYVIEKWCDNFAGSFLLPTEYADALFRENLEKLLETKTLEKLSRKYKVSKNMLLVSMEKLGYIKWEQYKNTINRYDTTKQTNEKVKIISRPAKDCVRKVGKKYVSLVGENLDANHITYLDALNYLSINSKYLDSVFKEVWS